MTFFFLQILNSKFLSCLSNCGLDLPLHVALRNNRVSKDAIKMMVRSCPESLSVPNKEGLMPLHICCRYCSQRSDLVELIAQANPKACHTHIKVSSQSKIIY